MTSIVIAEDHQSLIDGLSLLFENDPAFQIIGKANDGQRLIDIIKKRQPDVVLTDIRMPKIDGIVVTKMMKRMYPTLKVIAFTMFDEQESIKQMMEAGANGYILKNSGLVDVKEAIEIVMKGETYFDKSLDISFLEEGNSTKNKKNILTNTEMQILHLIGEGKNSYEIAEIRGCSHSTIQTHRKNMMKKLNLHGKGELLRYAMDKNKYDI
ncbi:MULTISPECIES: response regulator [Mesonia]|uniref:Oxygen regulatory protein NreC n=1 Tax=Mesonia oceanica TaxID=2687242 RepID=A0AC61Y898_9FLAO|nr:MULTISPECIES: response regulator transcription factor [Mesonia]MBJ97030.1 DNA-binding response regulator [Flavobacteriaceae bacterium]MAN29492.1 DNA-binding response regulator [Mesonia sp.]MAQ39471.1 DNA-binding response regulator [Mesonia sp.]MAQ42146.1 DNA-binding response regulator [Mesonia sp.]VVV00618.1 Oxygen regulatory protein NreC [Mesonia oceanica]|tara:strand:- start:117 stop:746 length:630 start_codon:yes stop_codon:yes gene_type:complete